MMKKALIALAVLAVGLTAHAEGFDYLAFECSDGTTKGMKAVGLELTFVDGKMVAVNATTVETVTLPLTALTRMFFTNTQPTDELVDGLQTVEPADKDLDEAETIYDLSGRVVKRSALRRGVYVLKKGSSIQKIQIR